MHGYRRHASHFGGMTGAHARWCCPKELTVFPMARKIGPFLCMDIADMHPLRWNDPKLCGISIPIVGAHSQPPSISRLAVLDRRLPCFHLLAAPGACGVWMPRRRREGRTRGRVSGVWIVPAGWLRARPPNGLQAIRVGLLGGMVPQRPVLVLPTPSGEEFQTRCKPPSGALQRAREDNGAPPAFHRASSVAWPVGTCDALGPSERRGRGLTSRSQVKQRYNARRPLPPPDRPGGAGAKARRR